MVAAFRTFRHDDGTTGAYDYTSENHQQRRRVEDVALVSHVRVQRQELVRLLGSGDQNGSPWKHMVYTAIYDDTNVWAPGSICSSLGDELITTYKL